MKLRTLLLPAALLFAVQAHATGLVTCDSGPEEGWQDKEELKKQLEDAGWEVRRIKVDGGCYEVYGIKADGERVEAYFDPRTFQPVPIEDEKSE